MRVEAPTVASTLTSSSRWSARKLHYATLSWFLCCKKVHLNREKERKGKCVMLDAYGVHHQSNCLVSLNLWCHLSLLRALRYTTTSKLKTIYIKLSTIDHRQSASSVVAFELQLRDWPKSFVSNLPGRQKPRY